MTSYCSLYGPVDLMVIQQQKMEASLLKAFGNISKDYGALKVYRGLGSTMIRESIYTMGYLGIAPVIQSRMVNSENTKKTRKYPTKLYFKNFENLDDL